MFRKCWTPAANFDQERALSRFTDPFHQQVLAAIQPMGNVLRGTGVIRQYPQQRTLRQMAQRLAHLQQRQGATQATGIQLLHVFFVHGLPCKLNKPDQLLF